jgi:hypothetical protein
MQVGINVEVKSVSEYVSKIIELYGSSKKHLFFRGHYKNNYVLQPYVLRGNKFKEKEVLLDFCNYADAHGIKYDKIYEVDKLLCEMQHYGLPTRLLDWSVSPFTPLFMACFSEKACKCEKNEDGQVYIFDPWEYNTKYLNVKYEKPNAHQINILARALLAYGWEFNDICEYLKRKYAHVDKIINEHDLQYPYATVSPFSNDRKLHQRGTFMVWGELKNAVNSDIINNYCSIFTVPHAYKPQILDELNKLYINTYTIYPDFKGMELMVGRYGSLFNVENIDSEG